MKKQITRISPVQTSKVIAFCYLSLAIITVPIGIGFLLFGGKNRSAGIVMCLAPVFYAVAGFVMSLIANSVYNFIAKRAGGIEVTVTDIPDDPFA